MRFRYLRRKLAYLVFPEVESWWVVYAEKKIKEHIEAHANLQSSPHSEAETHIRLHSSNEPT